jgi:hypothetical protein
MSAQTQAARREAHEARIRTFHIELSHARNAADQGSYESAAKWAEQAARTIRGQREPGTDGRA